MSRHTGRKSARIGKKRRKSRRSKKSKGSKKLMRIVKLQAAPPLKWIKTDTWEVDSPTYNVWRQVFSNSNTLDEMNLLVTKHKLDYATALGALGYSGTGLTDNSFVATYDGSQVSMTNSNTHPCILEMIKLKPKECISEEAYTDLSVALNDLHALVQALLDADPDISDGSHSQMHFSDYSLVKKYFKILKSKYICLESGEVCNLSIKAGSIHRFNGDVLSAFGQAKDKFVYSKGYFWFVRVRGTTVHDKTSDNKVGTGVAHLTCLFKKTLTFRKITSAVRLTVHNNAQDTIADGEAIGDINKLMKDDGEE